MTAAASPRRRRRGLSVHVAPTAAALAPAIAGVALAGLALTTLTPVADIEVLRAVTGRADVAAVIDRVAQADAAVARAYWAALALAGALIATAIGLYALFRRVLAQSLQNLADSVVETSRTDEAAAVWGRERADPLGVIARTVEVMQWERLRALAAAEAAETQGHDGQAEALTSAAAKADRIQDALSRSVTAVSQTCNDFQGVLDRAEKALNLASNAAWDGATAQRDTMNDAIAALRVIADDLAAAAPRAGDEPAPAAPEPDELASAAVERAYHATLAHIESDDAGTATGTPTGAPAHALDDAVAALESLAATLTRETEASADAARALTAQAAAFANDAQDAAHHTTALAHALASADAHAGRLAGDADAFAARMADHLTVLSAATPLSPGSPSADGDVAQSDRLAELLGTASRLTENLAAAADRVTSASDTTLNAALGANPADADPRLEDAIARLEALMASLSAADGEPARLDASALDAVLAPQFAPVTARLDAIAETLASAPAPASPEALDAVVAPMTRTILARFEAITTALDSIADGVGAVSTRAFGLTPDDLQGLQADLHVIKTLSASFDDSLTAAARGLKSHLADAADQAAATTAERVTQLMKTTQASVSDTVSSAVRAAAPTPSDVAEELERRLNARLAPLTRLDALAAQVKLVEDRLAHLNAPAAPVAADEVAQRVGEALEARLEAALGALQTTAAKLDAHHTDAAREDAAPRFDAERSSFRRMAVAFELVLRDVNAHAARLAEAVGRVEEGATPAPAAQSASAEAAQDSAGFDALRSAIADVEARLLEAVRDARAPARAGGHDDDAQDAAADAASQDECADVPVFEAGRDSFQRLVVGFRHVLRELGAQADALRDVVDVARTPAAAPTAPAAPEALEGEVLPPAPAPSSDARGHDQEAAAALEPFAADRASMQRVVIGFRHALRRLDEETDTLHDTIARLKGDDAGGLSGPSFAAFEERLSELLKAVQAAANAGGTADAAASAPEANGELAASATTTVLRAIDRLSARAATLNDAVARQGEVLRSVIEGAEDNLGDKAEHLVERLERAARDARAHTTEFLAIAAALSRDLDEARDASWTEEPAPTPHAAVAARAKRRITQRRRAS